MADLIVTWGRHDGVLEIGSDARTEVVAIDGSERTSELKASGSNNVVTLYAEADCWVAIGKIVNAENDPARRFLPSSKQQQFSVRKDDMISVVGA